MEIFMQSADGPIRFVLPFLSEYYLNDCRLVCRTWDDIAVDSRIKSTYQLKNASQRAIETIRAFSSVSLRVLQNPSLMVTVTNILNTMYIMLDQLSADQINTLIHRCSNRQLLFTFHISRAVQLAKGHSRQISANTQSILRSDAAATTAHIVLSNGLCKQQTPSIQVAAYEIIQIGFRFYLEKNHEKLAAWILMKAPHSINRCYLAIQLWEHFRTPASWRLANKTLFQSKGHPEIQTECANTLFQEYLPDGNLEGCKNYISYMQNSFTKFHALHATWKRFSEQEIWASLMELAYSLQDEARSSAFFLIFQSYALANQIDKVSDFIPFIRGHDQPQMQLVLMQKYTDANMFDIAEHIYNQSPHKRYLFNEMTLVRQKKEEHDRLVDARRGFVIFQQNMEQKNYPEAERAAYRIPVSPERSRAFSELLRHTLQVCPQNTKKLEAYFLQICHTKSPDDIFAILKHIIQQRDISFDRLKTLFLALSQKDRKEAYPLLCEFADRIISPEQRFFAYDFLFSYAISLESKCNLIANVEISVEELIDKEKERDPKGVHKQAFIKKFNEIFSIVSKMHLAVGNFIDAEQIASNIPNAAYKSAALASIFQEYLFIKDLRNAKKIAMLISEDFQKDLCLGQLFQKICIQKETFIEHALDILSAMTERKKAYQLFCVKSKEHDYQEHLEQAKKLVPVEAP